VTAAERSPSQLKGVCWSLGLVLELLASGLLVLPEPGCMRALTASGGYSAVQCAARCSSGWQLRWQLQHRQLAALMAAEQAAWHQAAAARALVSCAGARRAVSGG
jgi:hypothetical protein